MRFTARPVGAEWFDDNVPCTRACPVLTNAGRYVTAIAAGDDELAYRIARLPNPFPSICGRVCAAPCEQACRRGKIDEPIAIRALKRYVTEQYGVESGRGTGPYRDAVAMGPPRTERVAVVGAGPAGMACAHDLATYGYRPVVFEAQDRPGGMMVLGIPPYRLRRDVLRDEIAAILDIPADAAKLVLEQLGRAHLVRYRDAVHLIRASSRKSISALESRSLIRTFSGFIGEVRLSSRAARAGAA